MTAAKKKRKSSVWLIPSKHMNPLNQTYPSHQIISAKKAAWTQMYPKFMRVKNPIIVLSVMQDFLKKLNGKTHDRSAWKIKIIALFVTMHKCSDYIRKSTLETNISAVHDGNRPFQCKTCNARFKSRALKNNKITENQSFSQKWIKQISISS